MSHDQKPQSCVFREIFPQVTLVKLFLKSRFFGCHLVQLANYTIYRALAGKVRDWSELGSIDFSWECCLQMAMTAKEQSPRWPDTLNFKSCVGQTRHVWGSDIVPVHF